jgi:hypothetical protein
MTSPSIDGTSWTRKRKQPNIGKLSRFGKFRAKLVTFSSVSQVYTHPGYNYESEDEKDDICLLKIDAPAEHTPPARVNTWQQTQLLRVVSYGIVVTTVTSSGGGVPFLLL